MATIPFTKVQGTVNDFVTVVPADNVLNVNGNILGGSMGLWIGGQPGDLYALAYSPDLLPTVIPGVVEADIGAQFTSLFVFFIGNLNAASGVDEFHFGGITGTAGEYFYFQGVTIDPVTLALPWKSTNPATSIFTH